jgi:hypothetical protein
MSLKALFMSPSGMHVGPASRPLKGFSFVTAQLTRAARRVALLSIGKDGEGTGALSSAIQLRARAEHIRDLAQNLAGDVAVPRMLALAAELDARAVALDANGKSVWDQVSAGWMARKE